MNELVKMGGPAVTMTSREIAELIRTASSRA